MSFSLSPGTKRVQNNIVYNEYINDREHVHMNSTQWETLTEFTKWLGKEGTVTLIPFRTEVMCVCLCLSDPWHCCVLWLLPGFCKVDETPKGWYIQYIDRDPETIRRQEELEKKKKQDLDDQERSAKFIEEQVRRGQGGREPEVREYHYCPPLTMRTYYTLSAEQGLAKGSVY